MKRSLVNQIVLYAYASLCGVGHVSAQDAGTPMQRLKPAAPAVQVMAPPPETRAVVKLRPSTAEAGQSRFVKPPLKALPAIAVSTASPSSPSLQHTGHWLLLYRTDRCVPCDRLMNVLAGSDSADLRNGVPFTIIVGGASSAAVDTVRTQYSALANARWAADPDGSTFRLLQLRGSPELFAMDGSRILWKVSGNLGNPRQVLQLADSWIAGTAAADESAREKTAAIQQPSAITTPSPAKH